jgi:hypothetical protein
MAKDQDLPLNPTKISGVCGRLLCCLSYEHDQYLKIKAELPRKGAWVQTPDGPGEVIAVNVIRETVMVELNGTGLHEEFSPQQIGEAAQRVGNLARSRADEGITPAAPGGEGPPPKRERNGPPSPPRREPKHSGERRLLRDEIVDDEVLEALAMLEEGISDRDAPWDAESRPLPARGEPGTPPARTPEQRRGGPPPRRPAQPGSQEGPPPPARPAQQPGPARPERKGWSQPSRGERRPDEPRGERRPDEPRGERRPAEARPERRPDEPHPGAPPQAPHQAGPPRALRHRRKRGDRREE